MPQFLKLSRTIVNTSYIKEIIIKKDLYRIYLQSDIFSGFTLFGSGGINSEHDYITVCKKESPADYTIVDQWIKKIPDNPM